MHDWEKSDSAIVAVKPPNKAGLPVAEAVEPRAGTKGNADQQSTYRTQSRKRVIQALSRVRQTTGSPSNTQGRSRMLELGSSGSVRGVSSNGHPYRDPPPLRPLPAMVSFLSRKPALSLDGRNRSSCPKTALAGHVLAAAPAAVQEAIHSGNKPHHLKPSFL